MARKVRESSEKHQQQQEQEKEEEEEEEHLVALVHVCALSNERLGDICPASVTGVHQRRDAELRRETGE